LSDGAATKGSKQGQGERGAANMHTVLILI